MTDWILQNLVDEFTNKVMTEIFNERFTQCEDITEDFEMNDTWNFINDTVYESLTELIDE